MLTRPEPLPRTRTTGVSPRAAPRCGLRRPQRLAGLVLEADAGARWPPRPFTCGQVSAFHTATAPSSRSRRLAERDLATDQPWRRSRYQVPGMVYRTWNIMPISVVIRASVHRWSSQPVRRRPISAPGSSSASCSAPSRYRDPAPFDASPGAAVPPGPPPPLHRPLGNPQLSGNVAHREPALELLHDRQPDQFPPPAALGGRPAALRIPHRPCIPPEAAPSPTDIGN